LSQASSARAVESRRARTTEARDMPGGYQPSL
jgi:hypothetical protein